MHMHLGYPILCWLTSWLHLCFYPVTLPTAIVAQKILGTSLVWSSWKIVVCICMAKLAYFWFPSFINISSSHMLILHLPPQEEPSLFSGISNIGENLSEKLRCAPIWPFSVKIYGACHASWRLHHRNCFSTTDLALYFLGLQWCSESNEAISFPSEIFHCHLRSFLHPIYASMHALGVVIEMAKSCFLGQLVLSCTCNAYLLGFYKAKA